MKASVFALAMAMGLVVCLAGGCDSKQEATRKKAISLMEDYADVLDGIKSNQDFVQAKPKLEAIGAKMKDLTNEAKALPKTTAEEEKKLDKEFEPQMKKVGDRITSNMQRLAKIGVSPFEIMAALKVNPTELGEIK